MISWFFNHFVMEKSNVTEFILVSMNTLMDHQSCNDEEMNIVTDFTWLMSRKSWLTRTMPPSKSLMASASASMVSMSKWLVGSSRSRRWGACHARYAKTTRHFWPSLSCLMGQTYHRQRNIELNFLFHIKRSLKLRWLKELKYFYFLGGNAC